MRCSPPAAGPAGRALAGLLALVFAAAVVLLPTGPAQAHGTLAMSTPAANATVAEPLTEVELYFTEQVAANAYFTVTAPGGGRVDNGWRQGSPRPLDKPVREYLLVDGKFEPKEYSTGFPAVVTLAHLPAAGQYAVSYLSVASDGEPVRGTMTFRYTGRATTAPQGWQPPVDQPDPALVAAAEQHATSGHTGGSAASAVPTAPVTAVAPAAPPAAAPDDEGGLGWLAWAGGAVLVAAAVGFAAWRRRPVPATRPAGRSAGRPRARGTAGRSGAGANRSKATDAGRKANRPVAARRAVVTAPVTTPARAQAASARTGAVPARTKANRATADATPVTVRVAPVTAGTAPAEGATGTDGTAPDKRIPGTGGTAPGEAISGTGGSASGGSAPDVTASGVDGEPAAAAGAASTAGARLGNTGLALLVGGLVVALLAGFGLGRIGSGTRPAGSTTTVAPPATGAGLSAADGHQHGPGTGAHTHPGDAGGAQAQVTGLSVNAGGYTVQPTARTQPAGVRADYRFRIVGADGQAATRFAVVHDKPLHLVVVGRDLSGYQHLHPTMAADGTWSVPLTLARPGGYRIYADFSVTGADGATVPLVLGVDHQVPGAHTPVPLPPAASQSTAGPFTVTMGGTPTVGVTVPLSFRPDGVDPARLERYLGAYGHLVVVREGDLGYVHVHPDQELVDGTVRFWLTAPSTGRYRAFFDFQIDGKVHTAQYTLDLG
ncbi:copper resistance protein CopC [Micromonospora sp. WMMD987]|uniref:copper resistance protein CopC n=1 Tax=Micromonospora sp. WMMD987 TaxID=3016089 RepID=UPI00249A4B91|nr:copper resistance protein CopC [Micromonospora sp. WMMD987]WFE93158.1 copper resistance protein CopC [Micromonospora sp. WMMD987]